MIDTKLKDAIEKDNLVIFVGAGLSIPLGLPNWHSLVEQIILHLKEKFPEGKSPISFGYYHNVLSAGKIGILDILDIIDKAGYKKQVKEILHGIISTKPLLVKNLTRQQKIWDITNKIITTNYDKALDLVKPQTITVFTNDNPFQQIKSISGNPFLYKIHGDIDNPDTCILFRTDYEALYIGEKPNTHTLRTFLQNKTILFIGFSLDDPFINLQFRYLYDIYNGYNNSEHFIVLSKDYDFSDYNIKTILVNDWGESFDNYLDELIEEKKNSNILTPTPIVSKIDIDIEEVKDIEILKSLLDSKIDEANRCEQIEERRILSQEAFRIKNRILDFYLNEFHLNSTLNFEGTEFYELQELFDTIFKSKKLSQSTKLQINTLRDLNNKRYKWYHRSVIVSALACSIINHDDIDPSKVDFLVDFTNDTEENVWQKSLSYLVLILNHLKNKWLRFPSIRTKLLLLKENPIIQGSLKIILIIMQYEAYNDLLFNNRIFELNDFRNNPYNYFLPFYSENPSIDKLYERDDVEDIDKFIQHIVQLPYPDPIKYLIANNKSIILTSSDSKLDNKLESSNALFSINFSNYASLYPYINFINDIVSFYKNNSFKTIGNKLEVITVNNIKDVMLNAIESYRATANKYMIEKNWSIAIMNFEALLKISNNDLDAMYALSQCYDNVNKNIDTKLRLRKQIEILSPENSLNLFKIALIYDEKKNHKNAFKYIDRAIELKNNNHNYYNLRGISKTGLGLYKDALEDYLKAIELAPDEAIYYSNAAMSMTDLYMHEKSIEYIDKALSLDPDNDSLINKAGMVYENAGYLTIALNYYEKAIKINSKNISYFIDIAHVKIKLKYYESALNDINKALSVDSKSIPAYNTRADIYFENGDYEAANKDINTSLKISPKNSDVLNLMAYQFWKLGNFSDAHKLTDENIKLNPEEGRFYGTKAAIFYAEGNEESFFQYTELALIKKANVNWFIDDILDRYKTNNRFTSLLQKHNQRLIEYKI